MVNMPVRWLWVVLLAWAVQAPVWGAAPGTVVGPVNLSAGAVGTLQMAGDDAIDLGEAEVGPATPQDAEDVLIDDFSKGTWMMTTYASARPGDKGHMYSGHLGVGYYLFDDFAVNLEIIGGVVDVDHDDTGALVELDLILRWHFAKGDDWSLFAELGAGIIYTGVSIPRGGTNFNYTPQAGMGASIDLKGNTKLIVGLRYVHLSNARSKGPSRNPGWDGGMVYVGLMFPL